LHGIGFDWDPLETKWKLHYDKLVAYLQRFGDCLVPTGWKEDLALANWVAYQRSTKAEVPELRWNALNSIGFDWNPNESAWNKQYSKLAIYMKQNGHCNVPKEYPQDPSLGICVISQRTSRETMDEQKHRLLDEIGIDWDPLKTAWKEQFQKLIAYKTLHGDCNVPREYPQDQSLAYWVLNQRTLHTIGRLGLNRVATLTKIGFRWKLRDVNSQSLKNEVLWQTSYYDKLLPFLYRHGHCKIPRRYAADPAFTRWADTQRNAYNREFMRKDRMAFLDRVSFFPLPNNVTEESVGPLPILQNDITIQMTKDV
jgi:hypothetical protein